MSLDEQRITKIDSRNMQDITKRSNIHVIRIPESEESASQGGETKARSQWGRASAGHTASIAPPGPFP